jgi:hypothetical protein
LLTAATAWDAESNHSDYEYYVQDRTNKYADDFNSFLVFDGNLGTSSAYYAALKLAHDTTFDANWNLTCVWMDQHYNWSDATFRNRCGESLNLTVNLIADTLHSFYAEVVIPELPAGIILPTLIATTLFAVAVKRKLTRPAPKKANGYSTDCMTRGVSSTSYKSTRMEMMSNERLQQDQERCSLTCFLERAVFVHN